MSHLTLIVAITENNAIGFQGSLLYHLSDDLRRFKALTTGHTIIMGRKTFESFPKGALPNRRNIVLSHDAALTLPGAEVFPTLDAALSACSNEDEVFIIGGASVYRQALPLADKLCLTLIHALPESADAWFPLTDSNEWTVTSQQYHPADDRHPVPFTFIDCQRKTR